MNVLVVATRFPYEQSGASIRLTGIFSSLAQRHDITLACPFPLDRKGETGGPSNLPFTRIVALPPLAVNWPLEKPLHRAVSSLLSRMSLYDLRDILLLDPAFAMGWIAPLSAEVQSTLVAQVIQSHYDIVVAESEALINLASLSWPSDVTLILNSQNVLSSQLGSGNDMTRRTLKERLWHLKIAFYYESLICRRFDHVVAVSLDDKLRWARRLKGKSIDIVENGVDTDFFAPGMDLCEGGSQLVFVGGANYPPNGYAIIELVNQVFPKVRSAVSDATLMIIGKDPPLEQLTLSGGVSLLGYVDDIRPLLSTSTVFVAPIRQGGGTRLKILTAMCMGKAVVTTPLGAEGLNVRNGHDIVLAESEDELASATVDLLHNPDRRRMIGHNARLTAVASYSWTHLAGKFERQMVNAVECKRARVSHVENSRA